jgi:hypothetical protein
MAKKLESDALAKNDSSSTIMSDPLAVLGLADEIDVTGTEELGASDVRIPAIVFNTNYVPPGSKDPIPKTRFLNTLTEEVKEKLRLQVVIDHKSRAWSEFDEGDGKRITHCRSWDAITGRMEDGTQRPCAGCPDYNWQRVDGKNTRKCGDVHNLVAIDRDSGEAVMLALRRTAIRPFTEYFQKHFHRKRPHPKRPGARVDMPLFAYETMVELNLERGGGMSWAEPVFERGGEPLSADEIRAGAQACRDFRDVYLGQLERVAIAAEERGGTRSTDDTSFEFGASEKPDQAAGRF